MSFFIYFFKDGLPFHQKSVLDLMAMVSNTTYNNISALSWKSVLLVEETQESSRSGLNGKFQIRT
jgi:hypothetical protein